MEVIGLLRQPVWKSSELVRAREILHMFQVTKLVKQVCIFQPFGPMMKPENPMNT